jgi:hypothetical protein
MKLAAKILKVSAIIIISVLTVLFLVSLLMQNKVAGLVLKSLNNNFSTKIETGSYRLSLIKKFPKATVELKNVLVHSSHDFDRSGFAGVNTDTLLTAKSASLDFKMADMLRRAYTFTKITVRSGSLRLFTDTAGRYNYNVTKDEDETTGPGSTLNLNRINLSDVAFVYNDLRVNLILKGVFKDGRIKSRIRGSNIDFDGNSNVIFSLFRLDNIEIKQNIPASLEVGLNQNEKGIFFRKSTMQIENWDIILTGFIASDNYLDLKVSADNIDISKISHFLPEKFRKAVSGYRPEGNLKFDWITKGKPTRTHDPHYDIKWALKNAHVDYSKSNLKIERFSLDGSYTNGSKNSPETSLFAISNFTTRLGSADYNGSFSVTDFSNPKADLVFKGKLLPAELKEFLNLENVSNAGGSIDLNLSFSGRPGKKDSYNFADVFSLNSRSVAVFKSVGLSLDDKNIQISDADGRFLMNENTTTDKFRIILNKHKIVLSGNFVNFPGWLAGCKVTLSGSANVSATCIKPEFFMKEPAAKDEKGKDAVARAPVTLPDDVSLEVNFSFDTLLYKKFSARDITGILSLRPKLMNFRTISLNSQKGHVSGNGLVVQNPDKSFVGRGSFAVAGVDVNEAFTSFHNFGQGFLKAENLAGSLTGNITLILPVDSLLNPNVRAVTAEGKYILTNGALINFEPVKALSKFIELSELENIKFDKLENEFFIRNNIFYIPQMEIKSSAADLSVNGKHSFDNDYEYHVKMLLSEILTNKARKNRTLSDEFGEVEDDGLGRTSVFLKIIGKGEDVKASYDIKASGNQLKESLKKEKQTLKTIINEEYGLYKKDPEQVKKESASKPRFRIKWEGSDTAEIETQPPVKRKEGFLKKLFKNI